VYFSICISARFESFLAILDQTRVEPEKTGGPKMTHQLPYFYETEVEWIGGRKGELRAPGLPALTVATPPEFHGHEGIWTPEHFFVAAVNACLMTTFLAMAELSKLQFVAFRSRAQGKLEKFDGQGFQITEILLRPHLTIAEERDRERAERILAKAEKHCLISHSIKARIRMEPEISVAQSVEVLA
jgi:organic hydroperoxide reductase OsmC/OhrA